MEHAQSLVNTWMWQQGTELVMAPLQSSFFPLPTQPCSIGGCFKPRETFDEL